MALSDYITSTLGSVATIVGWDSADTTFITTNTLLAYGVATEAEATDLIKLHALCDIEVWKKVLAELAVKYDFASDGGNYRRNQMYESIKQLYLDAVTVGSHYSVIDAIGTGKLTDDTSPYNNIDIQDIDSYGGWIWPSLL